MVGKMSGGNKEDLGSDAYLGSIVPCERRQGR